MKVAEKDEQKKPLDLQSRLNFSAMCARDYLEYCISMAAN
jgi:hypothetical protein